MRYPRFLAVLGLMGGLGLAVALAVRSPAGATRPVRDAAKTRGPVNSMLRHELQQFLAAHPQVSHLKIRPRLAPITGSQTCFVGAGSCSLSPCVIPVQSPAGAAVPASSAVAVVASPARATSAVAVVASPARATSAVATVTPATSAPTVTVGPAVRSFTAPGSRCHRAPNPPRVLRVSGP